MLSRRRVFSPCVFDPPNICWGTLPQAKPARRQSTAAQPTVGRFDFSEQMSRADKNRIDRGQCLPSLSPPWYPFRAVTPAGILIPFTLSSHDTPTRALVLAAQHPESFTLRAGMDTYWASVRSVVSPPESFKALWLVDPYRCVW